MENTLINFETAKLAKEKGFTIFEKYWFDFAGNTYSIQYEGDEELDDYIKCKYKKKFDYNYDNIVSYEDGYYFKATQSLLQKWLREVHDILVYVHPKSHHYFEYHIIRDDDHIISSVRSNNWEEILELGLQVGLKLIKNRR